MPLDREETLKKAEKLLRQGRLDGAIAEYVRIVEDQPRDWNTANTLGDLYVRANQPDRAVSQYSRIADHFYKEGFYPKAAALYKKILKIVPDHEASQLLLGEISAKQGLLADAKTQLSGIAARRRARGDRRGADDIVVKLGEIDPSDVDARLAAARVLGERGDVQQAAARYRALHDDLQEKGRTADALNALRESVRLDPKHVPSRAALAKAAVANGDLQIARTYLDRETAGDDPSLLVALVDLELRSGHLDAARQILPRLLGLNREARHAVVELAWNVMPGSPEAAFVCVDAAVDAAVAADEFDEAAAALQEFVARQSGHVPTLLKLVEVCVDGGLEAMMYETQTQLADAYLAAGKGAEARVIAEDLVAREPWEGAHIERFRRALIMLRIPEPDTVIAERLSGQSPFVATDHFADPEDVAAARAPEPPRQPEPAPAPATEQSETLDDVFSGMREDAAREQGDDEAAQYIQLAETYLEMGMVDEAVGSFETAAESPRHRFEAASRLARLHRKQGDLRHAVEWFQRAAEAPPTTPGDGHALRYDLGVTLEESGDRARALATFLDLAAEPGGYRDAAERADRLARVQTGG